MNSISVNPINSKNSENSNTIIAVILGVIIFFIFILPMFNDKSSSLYKLYNNIMSYFYSDKENNKSNATQVSKVLPNPTNIVAAPSKTIPSGSAPLVKQDALIPPKNKENFQSNNEMTLENFKPVNGHYNGHLAHSYNGHASNYIHGVMEHNDTYYPINLELADSVQINNDIVEQNVLYNHHQPHNKKLDVIQETNNLYQHTEQFIADVNDPYNGDKSLTKLDNLKCSHQCCKHTQWPVPFDPVSEDSKILTDAQVDKVIGNNFSCNVGDGSGCLCVEQKDFDVLSNRSGNAGQV